MTDSSQSAERHRQVVLDYNKAFESFDLAQFGHLVEPDAYYEVGHNKFYGHEGFQTVAKMAKFLYPNGYKTELQDMIVEGNKVAARLTNRAVTNKGEDYENFYSVHFLISPAGKIAEIYEFTDTAYAHEKFSNEGLAEAASA